MDASCNFSFWDLYTAAFGKPPTTAFKTNFLSQPQTVINKNVQEWAEKAQWKTEERIGTDKKLYLAFFP